MQTDTQFKFMVVTETEGKFTRATTLRDIESLPKGDVLINVKYSSLNYKRCPECIGQQGRDQTIPHTPGIDAAGTKPGEHIHDFKG